jgi:hypothetical protein
MRHFFFYKDSLFVHVLDHQEDKKEHSARTYDGTTGQIEVVKIPTDQFYSAYKPVLNKAMISRLLAMGA